MNDTIQEHNDDATMVDVGITKLSPKTAGVIIMVTVPCTILFMVDIFTDKNPVKDFVRSVLGLVAVKPLPAK